MKSILTIIAFSLVTSLGAQNLTDSLVGYYPLTGDAMDQSGNNNHLTVKNAVLTADRNGQANAAYLLNGNNAYLGLVSASQFYFDTYSYSCWFKIDTLPNSGTTQAIMSIGGDIKDNGFNLSNKYVGIYSGIGTWTYHKNVQKTSSVDLPTFNDTNWHQMVATRNNDSIKFYLDGSHIGSDFTGDGAGYTGGGLGFYIGCRTGNTLFFKGVVDDVRIWKRVLRDAEVVQLYNSTATGLEMVNTKNVSNLSIYPIPSNGQVTINQLGANQALKVTVINTLGQVSNEFVTSEVTTSLVIENKGVYFLKFSDNQGKMLETRKIIIQ